MNSLIEIALHHTPFLPYSPDMFIIVPETGMLELFDATANDVEICVNIEDRDATNSITSEIVVTLQIDALGKTILATP